MNRRCLTHIVWNGALERAGQSASAVRRDIVSWLWRRDCTGSMSTATNRQRSTTSRDSWTLFPVPPPASLPVDSGGLVAFRLGATFRYGAVTDSWIQDQTYPAGVTTPEYVSADVSQVAPVHRFGSLTTASRFFHLHPSHLPTISVGSARISSSGTLAREQPPCTARRRSNGRGVMRQTKSRLESGRQSATPMPRSWCGLDGSNEEHAALAPIREPSSTFAHWQLSDCHPQGRVVKAARGAERG